jgi:hypothetical protein
MDMPKPGEKHGKLAKLVGEWAGPEKLHPAPWDPKGGPATARVVNRPILDGFGVVQEYEQTRGGQVNFLGHGVFWYDQAADEFVMTWWDSMAGQGAHYRGQFEGDRLVLGAPMPGGGQSRTIFDLSDPGSYRFLMEVSMDGASWSPAMEGKYAKAAKRGTKTTKAAKGAKAPKGARKAPKGARKAPKGARKAPKGAGKATAKKGAKGKKR